MSDQKGEPPVLNTSANASTTGNTDKTVETNQYPDPALDPAHQHYHQHIHHGASAHKDLELHADSNAGPRPSTPHTPEEGVIDHKQTDVDLEKQGLAGNPTDEDQTATGKVEKKYSLRMIIRRYRWVFHLFWGMFFTAWWISILAQDKTRHKWLIPTLLWLAIVIRLITFYVPTRYILVAADWVWQRTIIWGVQFIPQKLRLPAAAIGTVAVILIGTFVTEEYPGSKREDRAISFFGIVVSIFGLWVTSNNRKKIVWHTVITGLLIQYVIALFVLRTKAGYDIFKFISDLATDLLGFAKDGVAFLTTDDIAAQTFFFFSVLPAIIFFIAFVHLFYYWGVLQWFIVKFAYFFHWSMKVSGAESVVAAASPFIGQGESAILIKPFIPHLTKAEIHQVMTSGFATIAGSVLVSYIGMGVNPQALISSCVMSIPASLATSKLRYPETEETLTAGRVVVPEDDVQEADNVLHAFSNGAWLGLIIAGCIMTNLLCIIALVALINGLLGWFAGFWGVPELSLEQILGYICYPIAFLLGVPRNELYSVAKLIGVKIIQNEFVGYSMLRSKEYAALSVRSQMLSTYALCGFANLGSVATQIGVLGQLAPNRRGEVSQLAFSSLFTGAISTLMSAAVAGMVLADLSNFKPVET